jgi:hypothetical protein
MSLYSLLTLSKSSIILLQRAPKNLLQHSLCKRHSSPRRSAPGGRNATATLAPLLAERTSVTDTQTNAVTALTAGMAHIRAKGNAVPEHAIKAYSVSGGNAPSTLLLDNKRSLMASIMFQTLYRRTKRTAGMSNSKRWVYPKERMDVVVNPNVPSLQGTKTGSPSS